jgi:hypothetical protein
MTQVQARLHQAPVARHDTAVHVSEHDPVQQGIPRTEEVERAAQDERASRS